MGLTNNLGKLSNMITSTGSAVGIGTSSPNYKLQVAPSAVYGNGEDGNISINALPSGSTITSPTTVGGIVFGDTNVTNGYFGRLAVIQDNPSSSTASHMRFYTNSGGGNGATTEKVRITSVGVGIGTSSPSTKVHVYGTASIFNGILLENSNSNAYSIYQAKTGNSSVWQWGVWNDNSYRIGVSGVADYMTITSGGIVLVNNTTINTTLTSGISFQVKNEIISVGTSAGLFTQNRTSSNIFGWYGTTNFYAWNTDVGNIGQIAYNTGVYTPLSDINKKKDFELSIIGLDAVLRLKPTLYRMKTDDESLDKHLGFIAQEVKEFIPQAYEEFGEGENKFIGLNYNAIVAALTKAVQEQNQLIQELNDRLNKLENK